MADALEQVLPARPRTAVRVGASAVLVVGGVAVVAVLAAMDTVLGTARVGPGDLLRVLTGRADGTASSVVVASRLPRAAAGLLVGVALGVAGAAMQRVSRNVLAAPDTLAVSAGAYLALGIASVLGLEVPLLAGSGLAFLGGLAAAAMVLAVSRLGSGSVRLVLAGTALALGLSAVTDALILLFPVQTAGLYAWNQGSIAQNGFSGVASMLPLVVVGVVGLLLVSRRVDALALGDDAARGLGVGVGRTRVVAVVLAVLLSAAAVTAAGPVGFVGLCAPALVRPLARRFPVLHRSAAALPVAGLAGAGVVLAADVVLRLAVGSDTAVGIPTGVVTTVLGAVFLLVLAARARDAGETTTLEARAMPRTRTVVVTTVLLGALLGLVALASLLLGDAKLTPAELLRWFAGGSTQAVDFILSTRAPRVLAALLAGAALALAGALVQGVTRNPLADPGILGVSSGAGLGAVLVVTAVPVVGSWAVAGGALVGAALSSALVFGLAARGGFTQNRLVLVGIGVSAGLAAAISLVIVLSDPFNTAKALTWLSGSTYGRTTLDCVPVAVVLAVVAVLALVRRRELDLVSLDEDTPRLLGVRLGRARLLQLVAAVALTATATAAVGTIGFVGLVAPHAARALVGLPHRRSLPVTLLLGALLVCLGDVLGRTVVAPAQLGAGVLAAAIGTPYFVWLLARRSPERVR